MDGVTDYFGRVGAALANTRQPESFQNEPQGLSLLAVLIYLFIVISFSVGAAVLSYRYNVADGTDGFLTGVYVILAFLFSYFYYPFYALVLKGGKAGRK
jgi:UDP-N-acetylmuramyl pentapeptide phosphotransferase/UDP-N-acetylglucosamine-1-phosphate transferase